MKFKKGDTVRLNSGGPLMHVKEYIKGNVVCAWYNGDVFMSRKFREATLSLVELSHINNACPVSDLPDLENKPFHGCDGKPFTDKFLQYHLDIAIEAEDYEYAAKCRDEINRRKSIK